MEIIQKHYTTVNSPETVGQLLDHIAKHDIIAYDTETTGLNIRKDEIIGFSICGEIGESFYMPLMYWDPSSQSLKELQIKGHGCKEVAARILDKLHGKKVICHNGAFDIPITENNLGVNLLPDFYCETILLVHTVQEEGVGRGGTETFGLKKIAIALGSEIGLDPEEASNIEQIEMKESIVRNGGSVSKADYEIFKADLDLLCKYGAADTDLTLRIYHYYSKILFEEGLDKFFYEEEVMPVYREVTIPMGRNGVALDIPLLEQTKADLERDMAKYKQDVIDFLLKEEPGQRWVIDQALKNFPPKKTGAWGNLFIEKHCLSLPKTSRGYSTAKAAVQALDLSSEDEWQREFLLTNNPELVPEKERIQISLQLWKNMNDGDYFNVQSSSQLADVVFNYYKETPIKVNEETDQASFDGLVIQELSKKYDWVESLRIYRKMQKIYTTYVMRFLEGEENGRYYPYWKQNGTISGRFASNLQQLPHVMEDDQDVPIVVHYNHLVRRFIIAGKGRKFVDADFESLEPHAFAFVSGDEKLRDIFRKNHDFYSTIAIATEKLDQDKKRFPDGVSADKKSPVYLKKLDPVARNRAKRTALGIPYGMTAFALGKLLDISTKEAQKLIDAYFEGFPDLKKWYDGSRQKLYQDGYIRNYVGRIRHLKRGKEIYDMFGLSILNSKFRASLVDQLEASGMERHVAEKEVLSVYMDFRNAQNNCLNYQLQSLGADIVNRAALAVTRKMRELNMDGYVCAQIHDQIVINVEESRADELAPWVEKLMAETTLLPGVELCAPAMVADNMADSH